MAAGPGIPGPRGGRRPSTKRLSSDIERAYRESENAARTQSPRVSVPSATGSFSAGSFNSRASCLHRSARAASSTFSNSAAWLVVVGLPFAAGQRTEGHQVLEPCLRVLLQVVGQESVAARVGSGGVPAASPRGREPMASSSSRRLSFSTGSPISCRRRGSIGIGITASLRRITSSGPPSLRSRSGTSASGKRPRPAGTGATVMPRKAAATQIRVTSHARTTPHGLPGPS